jgi:hypothetical protein
MMGAGLCAEAKNIFVWLQVPLVEAIKRVVSLRDQQKQWIHVDQYDEHNTMSPARKIMEEFLFWLAVLHR